MERRGASKKCLVILTEKHTSGPQQSGCLVAGEPRPSHTVQGIPALKEQIHLEHEALFSPHLPFISHYALCSQASCHSLCVIPHHKPNRTPAHVPRVLKPLYMSLS